MACPDDRVAPTNLNTSPEPSSPSHPQQTTTATANVKKFPLRFLLAGGMAGAVSRTCVAPLDRIKILFQTQHFPPKYTSVRQAARTIVGKEGLYGLWRGNLTNCVRIVPYAAVQFYAYESAKAVLEEARAGTPLTPPLRVVAGAIAGMISTTVTYPLDLIRGRLTVQSDVIHYRGILDALRVIVRQEGVSALYKGLSPTLLGISPEKGLNFAIYETLKRKLEREEEATVPTLLFCGAVAGSLAQMVTYPLDMLRRRMQVQGMAGYKGEVYVSVADAFRKILRHEGITGFYKGLLPDLLKVVPTVAIGFVVYEEMKRALCVSDFKNHSGNGRPTTGTGT